MTQKLDLINYFQKMKKFAFCKCFYTNNIYIRCWDRHITFKSDEQVREDYKSFSSVELAMIEAEAEIARRMDGRNRWKERREIIAKKYSPIFANKLASYSNEFEIAPVFEGAFKDAIKLCKSQPNPLQLPAPSKLRNNLNLCCKSESNFQIAK
jgi:GMP synthase PP-ATPase subunit